MMRSDKRMAISDNSINHSVQPANIDINHKVKLLSEFNRISAQLFRPLYERLESRPEVLRALLKPLGLTADAAPNEEALCLKMGQSQSCLEAAANDYQMADLGAQLGGATRPGNLGVYSFLLLACDDFSELLHFLVKYQALVCSAVQLTVDKSASREFFLELKPASIDVEISSGTWDMITSCLIASMRHAMPENFSPSKIEMAWSAPPYKNSLAQAMHCENLRFDQAHTRIYGDSKWLDFKMSGANPTLKNLFKSELDLRLRDLKSEISIVERIEHYLSEVETLKSVSLARVAEELNIGERTLHRQLSDYGTNFRQLLSDFRLSKAVRLLSQGHSVDEITYYLGFSERAAFDRAFKKWLGITAAAFQKEYNYLKLELSIDDIVSSGDIPTLPAVANQLLDSLSNEDADMSEIASIVESDASLSFKLLALANSAMYGATKINNIEEAIIKVFGIDTLRNLSIAMLANNSFDTGRAGGFDPEYYWQSALSVGFLSSAIAKHASLPELSAPDCYLAGLLHNIGLLFLINKMPEKMADVSAQQAQLTTPRSQLCAYQESVMSTNTCAVGAMLFSFWHLPRYLALVARKMVTDDFKGEAGAMTQLISSVDQYFRMLHIEGDAEFKNKAAFCKAIQIDEKRLEQCIEDFLDKKDEIQSIVKSLF